MKFLHKVLHFLKLFFVNSPENLQHPSLATWNYPSAKSQQFQGVEMTAARMRFPSRFWAIKWSLFDGWLPSQLPDDDDVADEKYDNGNGWLWLLL